MENAPKTTAPAPPPPRFVSARAQVRVARLDTDGSAAGAIEAWQTQPTSGEWSAIHGPRAATTPLPTTCAFIGGLPGEVVEVEVRWSLPRPGRKRARHPPTPQVRLVDVLNAAAERVVPRCPVFGACGGCQLQHLAYERQLAWKTARVADALRAARLGGVVVAPAIGCADPWHYRNHMRFSVDRAGRPGLTARNSHAVIPLHDCPIAHPLINTALGALADRSNARPQLLIRCGAATGQVMIQPEPESAVRAAMSATGLDLRMDSLEERLAVPGGARDAATFRIRPSSFFQTNTAQANRMAELVLGGMPHGAGATLVDAYCGVGTFAALLAPHVGRVLAIEESASAVRDARWNLRDAPNVEVIQAKTEAILPTLAERVDGLVIDPPRAGCQLAVLDALCARRVLRVVYVSCEPSTLARDLAYLCGERGAYRITNVQPLDMFPQTAHIETVVALEAL